jgi:hypothetical protein
MEDESNDCPATQVEISSSSDEQPQIGVNSHGGAKEIPHETLEVPSSDDELTVASGPQQSTKNWLAVPQHRNVALSQHMAPM